MIKKAQKKRNERSGKVCVCACARMWVSACGCTQSCPTLCDPTDGSLPGSSVHGILQARILEWVVMPSCRGSSWLRDQTHISCISFIVGVFLPLSHQGSPPFTKCSAVTVMCGPKILLVWTSSPNPLPCRYCSWTKICFLGMVRKIFASRKVASSYVGRKADFVEEQMMLY